MLNLKVFKIASVLFGFLMLFSCAQKGPSLMSSEAKPLDKGMYDSKVDNFIVVVDTSSSMDADYNGTRKIDIARRIAMDMNTTLPEMGQKAGLRSFGHSSQGSSNPTELLYGMEDYSSAAFAQGLEKVSDPSGTTPMAKAINASMDDFEGSADNHKALIILSDGLETNESSVEKTTLLKEKFGESLCIHPILIGDDPDGENLMKELATLGGCGAFSSGDQLLTTAGMKTYVENVFLTEKQASEEVEPAPKEVKQVEAVPEDSDNDGVVDEKDECPDTPAGANVNSVGCWTLDQILFDTDEAVLKSSAYPLLDEVAAILEKNPDMNVSIQGHTDNVGGAEYNMELSEQRANAVKKYFMEKGIADSRMETKGFGLTKPVGSNSTDADRALNRRVEIHPK